MSAILWPKSCKGWKLLQKDNSIDNRKRHCFVHWFLYGLSTSRKQLFILISTLETVKNNSFILMFTLYTMILLEFHYEGVEPSSGSLGRWGACFKGQWDYSPSVDLFQLYMKGLFLFTHSQCCVPTTKGLKVMSLSPYGPLQPWAKMYLFSL